MHIPGHLSIALAQHMLPTLSGHKKALTFLMAASLFPDIVDKTVGYLFRILPGGRHVAHNIFGLLGTSLLITLIWGKIAGYAWSVGYLGHLMADDISRVPLFFPLRNYRVRSQTFNFNWPRFLKEMTLLSIILTIYMAGHKSNQNL